MELRPLSDPLGALRVALIANPFQAQPLRGGALPGGGAVAGAYHPALGELVRGRVLRNRAEALLEGIAPYSRVTLSVNERALSQMIGQRRCNIEYLRRRFSLAALTVRAAPIAEGEIQIEKKEGKL